MRIFAVILIVVSLLIGLLVDTNFLTGRFPIFSSFVIFLTAIYILSVKKSS
jgi:hypothetical protein